MKTREMWVVKCTTLFLGTIAVTTAIVLGLAWKDDLLVYIGLGGVLGMMCVDESKDESTRP